MKLFPDQNVDMVLGMEDPFHYRHKVYASFHRKKDGHLTAGMYQEGSHRVVATEDCLIQNETANAVIRDFTKIADELKLTAFHEDTGTGILRHLYLRVSHADGSVLLVIVIGQRELPGSRNLVKKLLHLHPEIKTVIVNQNRRHTSMILGDREKVICGPGYIFDEIAGIRFRISSKSFFQVNPVQTEVLYQTALDLAAIKDSETVLDLCCGIGTITLLAAKQAKQVTGIEVVPQAIKDAKGNALHNGIMNAEFICADIETYLKEHPVGEDVVIADPPRSGLGAAVSHAIGKSGVGRIVYVSCNPVTQKEDSDILKSYGYSVSRIIPVDMFCFTEHIESIVLLQKKNT